ncbi:YxeA family protein [Bacillus cereus]|uniref:YxeA family protein n=1 Tax=Bacillus cereus TaxID=1396 RepID=UPI001D149046|nr:YxeA family protein [Bacillus cereus]MCC3688896.1 YxeA family protein [Bacillus cereus]
MKNWFFLLLLIGLGISWFMYKGGIFVDGLNPFLKEKDYYVVVNQKGEEIKESGYQTWRYQFVGYDKSSTSQELPMIVSKQLKLGAYLQIHSKGQNVKSWREVQESEIPEHIKKKWKN